MAALDPGFLRVTRRTKRLQIAPLKRQFWMTSHRLDVINLQPPARATGDTGEPITAQDQRPQVAPLLGIDHGLAMARIIHAHIDALAFAVGCPIIRTPCATAITVAAAASIRPVERPRTSL